MTSFVVRCGVMVSRLDFESGGPGSIPSTVISTYHGSPAFSKLKSLRSVHWCSGSARFQLVNTVEQKSFASSQEVASRYVIGV